MGYILIDQERCKGCELCAGACPRRLIGRSTRINHIGYHPAQFSQPQDAKARCTGCTLCGVVCPEAAIAVYR